MKGLAHRPDGYTVELLAGGATLDDVIDERIREQAPVGTHTFLCFCKQQIFFFKNLTGEATHLCHLYQNEEEKRFLKNAYHLPRIKL